MCYGYSSVVVCYASSYTFLLLFFMIQRSLCCTLFPYSTLFRSMAVFISMRCTLCGHFLQVALTLILVNATCRKCPHKEIGRAVQQECRDRTRIPSTA